MNWRLFWLIFLPTLALFAGGFLFALAGLKILSVVSIILAYACICLSVYWAPVVMRKLGWHY